MTNYNNSGAGRLVKAALALLVIFGASQSYAACTQADLAGTWYMNGVSGNVWWGEFWETDFCKVRVNSEGKVRNSDSQCQVRDNLGKYTVDIAGGELTIASSCLIKGKIQYCDGEACVNLKIDNGRLDKGKTVLTIVGRDSDNAFVTRFLTGVKK